MEITRHFTATTFIVCKNKVLLHPHKKLGIWLPPGGHIDRDELPEEAALREIREETGLDVEIYQAGPVRVFKDVQVLLQPYVVLLETINPFHQHIDFNYFARSHSEELRPGVGESTDMRWLTQAEVEALDAPDDVKYLAVEALRLLSV
jgi:8-oxo-dGTP pyrophosphatase MutT (NUDIX family)